MSIKVVNVYKDKPTHFCGRTSAYKPKYGIDMSVLGNPIYLSDPSNDKMRDEVLVKFEAYFDEVTSDKNTSSKSVLVKKALHELVLYHQQHGELKLGCFCNPKKCHCDVIKKHLELVIAI